MPDIYEGDLMGLFARIKLLRQQNSSMLNALKAVRPLLSVAIQYVDCKEEIAQVEQAIKTAEGK